MKHLYRVIPIVATIICFINSGCAPTFSDYQSAKLAGKGNIEITPSITSVSLFVDKENSHTQNNYGGEIAIGVHKLVDVRAGYMFLDTEGDGGFNVIGFGPKISLDPDKVAFYIPVGFAFNDSFDPAENWELHPTLLFTGTLNNVVEITPSVKAIIPLTSSDSELMMAFNVGAGFGASEGPFIVRPEVGVLTRPGERGVYWSAGIGVTLKLLS